MGKEARRNPQNVGKCEGKETGDMKRRERRRK
jgi:hypothetical protein